MELLQKGDDAPQFSLPDQDGNEVSLADLRGKWVVLYFYPRDSTPGCTTEAVDFSGNVEKFNEQGAVIIGISRDSAASHRRFIEKQGLKVTLLTDSDHNLMEEYGVWQMKKMYGKESMGIVRSTFLIAPDGTIAAAWHKVKVTGHAVNVLETLLKYKKEATIKP